MIKNYFKISLRIIKQHKEYSLINIIGLAMGMACCIIILLWVQDEMSFDGFNKNAASLYRITETQTFDGETSHVARAPAPLAPALLEEVPEVINSMSFFPAPSLLVSYKENHFYESGIGFAGPSIFEMFTFPFLNGNPETALHDTSSIVITKEQAEKYFNREDPINKIIRLNNKHEFVVTGVIENVPKNSHLQFDFLLSLEAMENMREDVGIPWHPVLGNWGINFLYSYIQVAENVDIDSLDTKILNFIQEHASIGSIKLHLQPIKKIHLHSNLVADVEGNGSIKFVYIFSIVAFFVLFIACINFMNLSTAHAGKRAKEVGMRKISGAKKEQIILQFLGESFFLSFLSLLFAVCIVLLFLPVFNNLAGKNLSINMMNSSYVVFILIGAAITAGLLAGLYPAFFMSSFRPLSMLKSLKKPGPKGLVFKRLLVIFQFSLSILLIIATLIVHSQLHFIQNSRLGFEKEQMICIRLRGESAQYYQSIKTELLKNSNIMNVTAANQLPTNIIYSFTGADWRGRDPENEQVFHFITVDYDFFETLNMRMAAGRAFSNEFQTDRSEAFILNEKAASIIGWETPVGEEFSYYNRSGKIIGIVQDFHFENFYNEIEPLILLYDPPGSDHYLMVKTSGDISGSLKFIEETWNKGAPSYPFEFSFLDEEFGRQYQSEKRMGRLFNYFTSISVLIASLGLFGLASFMSSQRTKEIGIRRVVGASAADIVRLISKEFLVLVGVANIIAWPAAFFFMSKWLNNFVFKTNIQIWIFLLSALAAFTIALLSVSYKTIKAALANPVDSLRHE